MFDILYHMYKSLKPSKWELLSFGQDVDAQWERNRFCNPLDLTGTD